MKRTTFSLIMILCIMGISTAQEKKISSDFGMGFQVSQFQKDFGIGINMTQGNINASENADTAASVGIVTPRMESFEQQLLLETGRTLPRFDIMIETYGTLNADASNAILICHALSGYHHAAGYYPNESKAGWWDSCIGPNKAIDTNEFFVVALNNIGGCNGSTGPTSPNPENDNKPYGPDFPLVTVRDWVKVQALLADRLGIDIWHAIVGGSLGGMQALQWAVDYPNRLKNCVVVASTPKLSAQNIAFNEVARQSILSDPDFHDGRYLEQNTFPKRGLILARMVGHITYLSEDAMKQKFGRKIASQDTVLNICRSLSRGQNFRTKHH